MARMTSHPLCVDSASGSYRLLLDLVEAKEAMLRYAASVSAPCGHLPSD